MIDTQRLKGIIIQQGLTQKDIAHKMGISENTFYNKMKRRVFDSNEIYFMIDLLDIKQPCDIFFADSVACRETNLRAQ